MIAVVAFSGAHAPQEELSVYPPLFLLLKLSERSGKRKNEWQSINMRLTHLDIATMAGTTRETVSSLMGQLKKEGLIKKGIFLTLSINADKASQYI